MVESWIQSLLCCIHIVSSLDIESYDLFAIVELLLEKINFV